MQKTLGQIAHEAGEKAGGWARKWNDLGPDQRAEWEAIAEAVAKADRKQRVSDVDELAQHIRWLNGSNKMGAGILAEQLVEWLRSRV